MLTNTTPIGAYRGAGRPEATAALERAMDLFATEVGVDPADVRRKNLLPPFTEPHRTAFGALYDSGDYAAALYKALEAAGYAELRKEQAERRASGDVRQLGIGVASYVEITGMGDGEESPPEENATVEVHPDGTATILTGTSPHGQGHATAWAMLASDELDDLAICDRVLVLVRGEIFTEFTEPPFDRDELIVATEGMSGPAHGTVAGTVAEEAPQ